MKSAVKACMLVAVSSALSGCSDPVVTRPMGERWAGEDLAQLDGWWLNAQQQEDNLGRVKSLGNGTLVIAFLQETRDHDFTLVQHRVVLTRLGEHNFAFTGGKGRGFDLGFDGGYTFVLIVQHRQNKISFAEPASEAFIELIKLGELDGEIRTRKATGAQWAYITATPTEFLAAIDEHGIDKCFHLDSQQELRRVKVK